MGATKYILPVLAGAIAGMILISLGEQGMQILYPVPPGVDIHNTYFLAKYIETLPTAAFLILITNYAVCSFLAGVITTLVAKRTSIEPAIAVGIVLTLAGGLYNAIITPQPLWVSICSTIVFLPFVYLGYLAARKKKVFDIPAN